MDVFDAVKALRAPGGCLDPFPLYAEMHATGQGAAALDPKIHRYAAVAFGYEAVNQVLREPVFRVSDAGRVEQALPGWRDMPTMSTFLNSIFFINEPSHSRVRRLFNKAFTARSVTALEPAIVRRTNELLDELAALGADGTPVDFMAEFAYRVPSDVMGELIGVPEEDRAWYHPRALAITAALELGGSGNEETMRAADQAASDLREYFATLVALRRVAPRDDLVSSLAAVRDTDGSQLSETELLANFVVMFNAGFVTTTQLFGNGLSLLLDRPADLAALRADPELTGPFVEEVLRYEPSTHFVTRWAAEDTEVAGVPVAKGGSVLILLGAANRDPKRFARPDVFDLHRPDNHSVSFGGGAHYCLGAALTRFEGRLAFPLLLEKFPELGLAEPLGERAQLALRGYDRMMLKVG